MLRRYTRTLVTIGVLVVLSATILVVNPISLGGFERGDDTLLGLSLGLDLQGGSHLEYQAILQDGATGERILPDGDQMAALLKTIQRRVNNSGLGEPIIQQVGEDRVLVQLPGVDDLERAKGLIGETATLEFRHRALDVEGELGTVSDGIIGVEIELEAALGGPPGAETTKSTVVEPSLTPTTSTVTITPSSDTATPSVKTTSPSQSSFSATPLPVGTSTPPQASGDDGPTPVAVVETATTTSSPSIGDDGDSTPVLILEFTEEAADLFAAVVDRLRESIEPVEGTDVSYPNYLKIAASGGTSSAILLPYAPIATLGTGQIIRVSDEPYVERIGTSTTFRIDLVGFGITGGPSTAEDARVRFQPETRINLIELLGKVDEGVGLTGEDLERAYAGQQQSTGLPIVNIEFNSEGTRKFGELTTEIAGTPDLLAIVLDDQELIAPTVRQPILGGAAIIEGRDFTFERVRDIALLLESGRLPIPIELIKEESVDAILGADSLSKSVVAGLVGLGLVLLFMAIYYRAPGILASIALVIYAVLLLSIFKALPVTLRLAGISAAILSIGMAVDANILIFERMKEELRTGRTLLSAVNIGFNRAWPAIRDSNVSTLITCGILFWFADTLGAPVVQSFAVTLSIGVAVSLFSAITVSRTLLRLVAATPIARRLVLFVPGGKTDLPTQTTTDNAS